MALIILVMFGYLLYIQPKIINTESPTPESTLVPAPPVQTAPEVKKEDFWIAPDVATLENNPEKEQILYGKELIAHTSEYFGTNGKVKKNAINGMNCQNCHLDAGTKVFGNNYGAVFATYPKYRARSGKIEDIYKRVNDCFERSLNGEPLPINSKEMNAIASYINWLGKDVPKGEKAKGSGFKDIPLLDRPADPEKGKLVYSQKCMSCHQADGAGLVNTEKTAYTYPPLWGASSYNDGAGLYRISNFAKYVKYNMPLGTNHENSQLSDEEAWDIAAFVNSQPRPKKNISKDWPKIAEKPFDHPFGPYADGFDEKQHKYGPFKPIKEKIEEMKAVASKK
ncbi:MAG: c-type cytochrome [Bacteroidetes bacterium]|nr:c-type cytochrome [Bacteroidota bacterium]